MLFSRINFIFTKESKNTLFRSFFAKSPFQLLIISNTEIDNFEMKLKLSKKKGKKTIRILQNFRLENVSIQKQKGITRDFRYENLLRVMQFVLLPLDLALSCNNAGGL